MQPVAREIEIQRSSINISEKKIEIADSTVYKFPREPITHERGKSDIDSYSVEKGSIKG